MKRIYYVIFSIFLISFPQFLHAQQDLTNINSSWSTVLSGKLICPPEISTYGFGVITDAKNLLTFSNTGKLKWEKHISKCNSPIFTFLPFDFITLITDSGKHLFVINPDGKELWNKNFSEKIIDKPVAGRDGRFFFRTKDKLFCYTVTGIEKWTISTPKQSILQIQIVSDGSLIVFLEEMDNNKTKAIRITPFGEIIEEITFSGEVEKTLSTPNGVLLTFTDGTCGLFDINHTEKNQIEHKWLLKLNEKNNNPNFFVLSQKKDKIIYLNHHSNSIEVDYINPENGDIYQSFFIQNLKPNPTCFYNDDGILIADNTNAYFFNNNGKLLWSGKMPQKGSREYYNHLLFTTDNHFILFGTNWSLNAFRTTQSSKRNKKDLQNDIKISSNYNQFYTFDSGLFELFLYLEKINNEMIDDKRFSFLQKGNYGKEESLWISELSGYCSTFTNSISIQTNNTRTEKTVFEKDLVGTEKMLFELSSFGTDTFSEQICLYLKKIKNTTLLHSLLCGIAQNGYDSDYMILQTLSTLCKNTSVKNELILCDICDAAFSICMTMGTEAIDLYGKSLFTELLYPKYSSTTKTKARECLSQLVSSSF